ncbi:MAG: hypothetical protein C0412_11665, partial [Flavobacterium sp.]|nr:hypothetical protein [Flavobacterium sp.]
QKYSISRTKRFANITFLLVTILFAAIFTWNEINHEREVRKIAIKSASDAFDKDILYRQWNTMHGGVYVPVTSATKPNPYLDVPDRDIISPSGKVLTLVNPAYMTRQVFGFSSKKNDIKGHLTSLKPLRPENSPDLWEKKSLEKFIAGDTVAISFENLNGDEHLRFMKPFITGKGCLRCHAKQGYKEGDVRGGISISVPLLPIRDTSFSHLVIVRTALGLLWIAFTFGLVLVTRKYMMKESDLRENENKYGMYFGHSPEGIFIADQIGKCISVNPALCSISGYSNQELQDMYFYDLIDSATLKSEINTFHTSINQVQFLKKKDGSNCSVLFDITRLSDNEIIVFIRDITEQVEYEKELTKSLEWQEAIIEGSRDAVFISDANAKFVTVNQAAVELTGYSRKELLNMHIPDLHEESDLEAYKKYHRRILDGEKILSEAKILTKNKHKIETEFSSCRIIISDTVYMHTTAREITERKLAEYTIRISEEKFRRLYEDLPTGSVIVDLSGHFISVNKAFSGFIGYDEDELLGKSITELTHSEDLEIGRKEMEQMIKGEINICIVEKRYIRKDGSIVWGSVSIRLLRDNNGSPLYFIPVIVDITTRREMETALRQSEEKYRTLIETVNTGIFMSTIDGQFIHANSTIADMAGYDSVNEFLKVPSLSLYANRADRQILINELLDKDFVKNYEILSLKKDGSSYWISISAVLIKDVNGNPVSILGSIADINDRKQIEMELEKYRFHLEELIKERTTELEKVNLLLQEDIIKQRESEEIVKSALLKEKELSELKSKFISITSHEFRTPLTTIISSAQLLGKYGRTWDEDRFLKHTERIQKSVQYLTNLLNDVLTISRTESGKIKFEPRLINLKNLCLSILEDISVQLTDKHKLNFEFLIPEEKQVIDEKLITFILFNLLSNAIKYSIDGGIVDFIVALEEKNLVFTIHDDGIGIPETDQSNLFEPFNRGQNVGTISGTGLGMSIVKRSVDIHGGSISFESKVNNGSRFFVRIPIDDKK